MRAPIYRPLIAHVVHRFAMGGLENGVVNVINRMPDHYRHVIICLDGHTDFATRIEPPGVDIVNAKVTLGTDISGHLHLFRLIRQLRPDVLHTHNIATIEANVSAALLKVPVRIHGEHGRDSYDPAGTSRKYKLLRRMMAPVIHQFVAVSEDLAAWLASDVGIDRSRVLTIHNGVDTGRFRPIKDQMRSCLRESLGCHKDEWVIGFIGRFELIKDPMTLTRAFIQGVLGKAGRRESMRLMMIGEGTLRSDCLQALQDAGLVDIAYLPGAREDIPDLMQALDVFVLPSQGEGLSNTILEAMASGLPVVATNVGGNRELVREGVTGFLVPPSDPTALANALEIYSQNRGLAMQHGAAARIRIEAEFSIDRMVTSYRGLYDALLGLRRYA